MRDKKPKAIEGGDNMCCKAIQDMIESKEKESRGDGSQSRRYPDGEGQDCKSFAQAGHDHGKGSVRAE